MDEVSHKFFKKAEVPDQYLRQIAELGQDYERAIGGIDMGFAGLWQIVENVLSLHDEDDKVVGFLTGSDVGCANAFEGEKRMYLSAAYLAPDYRNSSGKHEGVLKNALESLVDTLEEEGFDRLRIFPPRMFCSMLVTDVGKEKVLRPLYDVLQARNNDKGRMFGTGFDLQYAFNADDFDTRLQARKAKQGE
ncbi:hypothetical protein KY331_03290 [Candidatus Woesearchaeota archaeon]|nr:hypothetical protein [Candidatus Woesearchaeota archaeon]